MVWASDRKLGWNQIHNHQWSLLVHTLVATGSPYRHAHGMEASDEHQHSRAQLAGLARGEPNGTGQ